MNRTVDEPLGAPTAGPMARIVETIVRWRNWLLALAALAVALAYQPAQRISFDRSIENMFAADDPLLGPYARLQRTFGADQIVLAAYVDPELLSRAGLARLQSLTDELSGVPGVEAAYSLTTSPLPIELMLRLPVGEKFLELSEGYTIGADRRTAGVVCVLEPEKTAATSRDETIDRLRAAVEAFDASGVLAGAPVMVVDGFRYIDEDGRRLGLAASVLLSLTIVLCFRSIRWVVVPMAVVYTTLVLTQAALAYSGLRLSMVSSMLWAIVTVIGIATVVHLIIAFRELRGAGCSPREAMTAAAATLAAPIAWACLTDAAGFGSLLVARVGPVQDFGTMMVIGSLVALAAIAVLVPGLALLGSVDADPKRAWGERSLDVGLKHLVYWIEHHPKTVALFVALTAIPPLMGIRWLEVESDFTANFRRNSPIVRSYEFVESRLGGAGVWDVIVPLPEKADPELFARLRRLEQRLRAEVTLPDADGRPQPGLTKVLSIVDVFDVAAPGSSIPSDKLAAAIAPLASTMPMLAALHGIDPADGREYVRVMIRSPERQSSAEKEQLIAQVGRISEEEFPGAQATGFFVLLTRLIESMLRDQWITFGVAAAGIGVMMLAAFRSLRLAMAALVPNALPILVVTGMLGWLGIRINMGAAMIASVSMGLAVDSSIHYITAFQRLRQSGRSLHEAIYEVHQRVGRAMIFSTLALIVGFTALCLSQFVPTIYFGVLVSLAMIGGMAGNLVLLPLLLAALLPDEKQPAETATAGPSVAARKDAAQSDATSD